MQIWWRFLLQELLRYVASDGKRLETLYIQKMVLCAKWMTIIDDGIQIRHIYPKDFGEDLVKNNLLTVNNQTYILRRLIY